jgi:hypothetical protein
MIIFQRGAFIEILKISKKISNSIFLRKATLRRGGRIFVQVFWSGLCESRHQTELVKEKRIGEEGGATETQLVYGCPRRERPGLSLPSWWMGLRCIRTGLLNGGTSICQMVAETFGKSCASELKLDFRALCLKLEPFSVTDFVGECRTKAGWGTGGGQGR